MADKKLILVVDDERDIVEIVSELLEEAGYATAAAYDGKQALELLEKEHPAAMVLDVKMPVLDGLEVIRRLRKDPALAATPVVILTATQVIHESIEVFKQLKVKSWLSKPFEPTELVKAVKKAVSGEGASG